MYHRCVKESKIVKVVLVHFKNDIGSKGGGGGLSL
jgi:hypothetical protein